MSPEGFLVTKRWRKRQPTLSLPAHAASLHSTPTQHRSTSSSLLARSLSPSCQVQTGHTLQPTTVHDFLESLHSTPKKPKKGKKRKEHMPRQNGSQHVSTLPPLIFEDGICTPVLKFRPRPHPPSIRFKARHRPALSAPIAAIPTSSSEDKLSFDLSNFKQLSSWKEKIDVKSSSIQESRKKELQLPDCQKKPKGTSRPSNKRRATIQKPTSKTLKQLELMGSDDRFPPYEPKSDPQQWLSHSSNIDHIKVKPVSAFTTIHQATRFLSPLAELPVECSPVESEPITSSPPRLDPPTRLVSVADSIVCSPKFSRSRISRPRNTKIRANDVKKTVNQDLRILNLRNISMDENEVELRTPVQSSLRPRRLDLQELSTRPSIDPPDGWEKEPDRQLRLLSSTPHCASASNTVTFPRLYSRPRKRPSFSAEEILERLLPVASQVSNSSWLEKETAAHVVRSKLPSSSSSSSPAWRDRQDAQSYGCGQQKCPASSVVRRTKSILRHRSTLIFDSAGNSTLRPEKLRRRMTVMFDDHQTVFGSSSSDPQTIKRKLSHIILPPSSIPVSTPVPDAFFGSSPVKIKNRKPIRRLSDLPRSFNTASSYLPGCLEPGPGVSTTTSVSNLDKCTVDRLAVRM